MDTSTFGGIDFVSACTAINLAWISWDQFQEKVRFAQRIFEGKLKKGLLDFKDQDTREEHSRFYRYFLSKVKVWSDIAWNCAYLLSIFSTITGMVMLYCNASCKWDFLLLLPSALYIFWTLIALIALLVWMSFINRMLHEISIESAEKDVQEFISETTDSPPKKKRGGKGSKKTGNGSKPKKTDSKNGGEINPNEKPDGL